MMLFKYFQSCALVLSLGSAGNLSAAEPAAKGEEATPRPELETVQVTAARRSLPTSEVAGAVGVVSMEQARTGVASIVTEALRGQAGTFFQQTTPGQGIPIIRGLKGSQLLHLVDGMRLNNAFFRDAPNQYLALVDPFALGNVEVLRGAAGLLRGPQEPSKPAPPPPR